ncbi:hypothetical protein [Pseudanabaena sp. 'Roaring Creek']|uniref:hypothetical protein n=1 Tax=Pseudanabaena sp. 'Roaring Creek' TaxID=1681830 RepID=UPI000A7595BE|nr:hypothetical protein [Pseudanabaena sp. 'Roaring Creek']
MPLDSRFYCLLHKYIFSDYAIAPSFKLLTSDRLSVKNKTMRSPHHSNLQTVIAYSLKT